jgi:RNA polymerase sigma factor (sigma-70 family)
MATVLAPSRTDRAFERLYRRYVADVYRYVLAVLQNAADAEDATQTAFLLAYRAYERGERPDRPLNWLIAIAHNVCRQRFRESARRPRVVELQDNVAASSSDEEAPNAEDIRRALGFLAFNQRAALVMRELQGHSYAEIARILGVSTSAVETLLFRARRALREQLEGGLSCGEAELALSKRADGELSFSERGPLRAHLRECPECAALERRLRFRARAIRSAAFVPLPGSLSSFFGGGAAATGGGAAATGIGVGGGSAATGIGVGAGGAAATSAGVGAKAAAVVVAGVMGSGLAGDGIKERAAALVQKTTAAPAPSALAQDRSRADRARPARRSGARSMALARPGPARRTIETTPWVASAVAGAAAASSAPSALVEPAPAETPVSAPEPTQAAEPPAAAPAVAEVPPPPVPPPPVAPVSQPAGPEIPELPSQPEPPKVTKLPDVPKSPKEPELPNSPTEQERPNLPKEAEPSKVPTVPELPDVPEPPDMSEPPELPFGHVDLPEAPQVEVTVTTTRTRP